MKRALILLILGTIVSGIAAYAASARPVPEVAGPETNAAR
jgi:hypothetical protein